MSNTNILQNLLLKWHVTNGVTFSFSNTSLRNFYPKDKEFKNRVDTSEQIDVKVFKNNDENIKKQIKIEAKSIDELILELKKFEGCALKRTAKNLVFSDGNKDSKVMVIGEAPGEDEDRIGKPFVGKAGQLLDKMLNAIGQDRNNTYISNLIFWRPPGNRNPNEEEINACLPFVYKHLEIIKPKILILAGAISSKIILDRKDFGITQLRGQWYDVYLKEINHKIKAMPIYHPAFLMRQPIRKREAWEDLKNIEKEIKKIT